MLITFMCVRCDADFDIEMADLVKDATLVVCPNCNNKGTPSIVENAVTALDEAMTQFARLSRKFSVGLSMEADEAVDEDDFEDDDAVLVEPDDSSLWSDEPEEEDEEDMD